MTERRGGGLLSPLYAALILVLGLAYRAPFLAQGFNGTDEGWLQSLGRRIALGEVPYRDFNFWFPPVSIYKEAAFIAVFGDAYGLLFSRWAFSAEAALGSVLAFLIVGRFTGPHLAFLVTLPNTFFSVLLYYFPNYTYDGEILALAAVALLLHSGGGRRWPAVLAGVAAGLAVLAKPPFAAFGVLVLVLAIAGRRYRPQGAFAEELAGLRRHWPLFLAGGLGTGLAASAYFAVQGALGDLLYQTLVFPGRAQPLPLSYKVFQDLPEVFRGTRLALFVFVLAMVGLAAGSRREWIRAGAALAIPTAVVAYHLYPSDFWGRFLAEALGLLLILNTAALVLALVRRDLPFPPELPALALALQYLAQFTLSGVWYSYLGAYLSVPVALLLLRWLAGGRWWARALAPGLAGGWLAAGSVLFLVGNVYRDAPRPQLTAAFHTAKLAGIRSAPANVERVDAMVEEVERDSRPGEPIFAFPDFPVLYFLTDRRNPTRQDWYNRSTLAPEVADEAAAELARDPPRVVFVQTYAEWDFLRATPPLDYEGDPKFAPVYRFIVANYVQTGAIGDILVYRPKVSG